MQKPMRIVQATRPGMYPSEKPGEDAAEDHADRPDRDQAQFDLPPRQPAGQRAAEANAEGHGPDDDARLQLVPARVLALAEHVHRCTHEGDDEREEGDADDGERQRPRREEELQVADRAARTGTAGNGSVGFAGGHPTDEQRRQRPDDGQNEQDDADVRLAAEEDERQDAAGHRAEDDGQERERFEDAVAA